MSKLNREISLKDHESEELRIELTDVEKKTVEYERRIMMLSEEIERLNSVLERKNIEIGSLNKKLIEIDQTGPSIVNFQ